MITNSSSSARWQRSSRVQQRTEIQLPAGNTDAQRRQRINEAVECLIASLFAVPQYFFPAIHPFFDLLFSSQLLRFGQIKNIRVIREVNGTGKRFIPFRRQCEAVINLLFRGIRTDFGKVNDLQACKLGTGRRFTTS